jgi:hypothetical protein
MTERSPVIDAALASLLPEQRRRAQRVFDDTYRDIKHDGKKHATVQEPDLVALAGEMIKDSFLEAEANKVAERARKRRQLSTEQFWLAASEAYDLDEKRKYDFLPTTSAIHARHSRKQQSLTSIDKTIERYVELVETALEDPVLAGQVASDHCLPMWLRLYCAAITEPSLRPSLRKLVEESLADPGVARRWELTAAEDGLDDWMVDLFRILGTRQKPSIG